jgi:hypothetical protein
VTSTERPDPEKTGERILLGHRTPESMVDFQWTGNEPEGLNDVHLCELLGAVWEGDELVTYNYPLMVHNFSHWHEQFLEDAD